jgi:hypothetical protein
MIIAEQKKKENIVEYIIYMWQVEDLIRACRFQMKEIELRVIPQYEQKEAVNRKILQWYRDLIDRMHVEKVTEKGHLQMNRKTVEKLNRLHLKLLNAPHETAYSSLYYRALPAIVHLRSKSGGAESGEIETCLIAVYGYLMMKLQHMEISAATLEGVDRIGDLLACLASRFHEKTIQCSKL